ncbi:uncharacterized protein LOC106165621 [Lingula anatina]|uniref:Uncharacterized protein LOC106165621 n=1 Tax=Lingula anatina TaxID=7574 RepID=A0A1S3IN87_LINAN|nr:uncharacterized protein LOC106165621 [Lingula anatina]|eukprot:XP_013399361.1 uncharacterized protein LOC106165621 [Lingula anatina]
MMARVFLLAVVLVVQIVDYTVAQKSSCEELGTVFYPVPATRCEEFSQEAKFGAPSQYRIKKCKPDLAFDVHECACNWKYAFTCPNTLNYPETPKFIACMADCMYKTSQEIQDIFSQCGTNFGCWDSRGGGRCHSRCNIEPEEPVTGLNEH